MVAKRAITWQDDDEDAVASKQVHLNPSGDELKRMESFLKEEMLLGTATTVPSAAPTARPTVFKLNEVAPHTEEVDGCHQRTFKGPWSACDADCGQNGWKYRTWNRQYTCERDEQIDEMHAQIPRGVQFKQRVRCQADRCAVR